MKSLLEDLQLAVPADRPEPDPREKPATWVQWFRGLTHCNILMARDALIRRRTEWERMDAATNA